MASMSAGQQLCTVLAAVCLLLSLFSSTYAQLPPIATANFCAEDGLSDNLSCENADEIVKCFSRDELCDGTSFCMDGSDEGLMTQLRLDCDGSLTGRKPDENGKIAPMFLCSDGSVLDSAKLCDGTADCPSGDDETHPLCANKCRGPYYGGCSTTRECQSTPQGPVCGNCRPGFARNPRDYTIGHCLVASFSFRSTRISVCEGSSISSFSNYVQLQTTGVLDQAVRVTVTAVDGTATAAQDFTPDSRELVFSPFSEGGARRRFNFRTISDGVVEGAENFLLKASAGDWPFPRGDTVNITINECSTPTPQRQLVTVSYSSVSEGAGVLTVTITLASGVGLLQEDVIVDVSTSDSGSASENLDYTKTETTLTFLSGTRGGARMTFSVPILDDNIAEYNEHFRIIASVRGNGIGEYSRTTHNRLVRINDNDPFIVAFERESYTVMEGDPVEVCVVGITDPDLVHPFYVNNLYTLYDCNHTTADATPDVDYAAEYGRSQVRFNSESTKRECITIQTYHDERNEPSEIFLVRSGSVSGLGRLSQNPLTTEIFITNVKVDPVTVSIEQARYTVSETKSSSVDVCVLADSTLDQSVNISLQSSYESKTVTLSRGTLRSCASFSFPSSFFDNSQTDNIRAQIMSDNRRVSVDRSITEVIPLSDVAQEQCLQLANPLNGQVDESLSGGLIEAGSIATYSCDVGYVPNGRRFRECLDDLLWSDSPPTCTLESLGDLASSANQVVLGYFKLSGSRSPFLISTTSDPQSVYYTATSDSFSSFGFTRSNTYRRINAQISREKGTYVQAEENKKFTVHGWDQVYTPSYSIDCFLAFSTSRVGRINEYEYYSLPFNYVNSLLIVAREDNTQITLPTGSITLNQFQSHQVDDIPSSSLSRPVLKMTSNKPVSVFSAKSCSNGVANCDYLVEQVLPTHLWRRLFLVASFSGLKTGETIRVIFSKSSTFLEVTCTDLKSNFYSSFTSRGPGFWEDIKLDRGGRDMFCVVQATDPVYVVQFAQESVGDSYMMTIPSIHHYGEFFQGFYTPNPSSLNFVTVYITPEYYVPGVEGISVDGIPVVDWTAVRCSNGSLCGYIARPILRRSNYHTVVHTNPRARVGVSAYGYIAQTNTTYGYPVNLHIPPEQNVNECLPEFDICPLNSECVMRNGRYECVCASGYQRIGQTLLCIDVNECEQDSNSCDLNAQCNNTVGSFICTCNKGFIGSGRICTPESPLEPYKNYIPFIVLDTAEDTAGSYNQLADDECVPVSLNSEVPIGAHGMKISRLWICDNGVISLGNRPFKIWRPQLFPSDNPIISHSNVLAIFWNDHQPASTNSKVSYQIFEKGTSTQEENTSMFIREQGGKASFMGTWMIAVSWENVSPFTQSVRGGSGTQLNTYQAILITDFTDTYTIFTYNDNNLQWFGTGPHRNVYSVIGYNFDQRMPSSSAIPSFLNHRLSGSSAINEINQANKEFNIPWANVIYHIGNDGSTVEQSSITECRAKESWDISLFSNTGVRVEQGLACPCTITRAFNDRRYSHASGYLASITGDTGFNSRNCFVQVFRPLGSNRGAHLCCYSVSEGTYGALLGTAGEKEASSPLRFHPYTEPDQFVEFDYSFYESCCLQAGECNVYTDQRKADDCKTYRPSSFAWAWGDPHITTLDGMVYTFNGWGEYVLLEINTTDAHFLLQGRTHPVANSKATQFVGFAFGSTPNNTVEVRLGEDNTFIVLLRGSDITVNISSTNDLFFSPNQDVLIRREAQNSLTSSFPLGISVTVNMSSGMLSFVLEIPDQFQNVTRGLMGNNNGNETDDIAYRNGTMLAHDVSDRLIHEVGQSWQITPEESLFTYPEGMSAEDFSHPDHIPEFLDDVVPTVSEEVLTACGESVECIFDASQTGNISIGLETMVINVVNVEYRQEAINNPPVILGPPTLLVTLGRTAELIFTVTDDNNLFNVSVVNGLPVNSTLTSNAQDDFTEYIFSWTLFEIVEVSLIFAATDERNAVSVLSVQVQICACENGGDCTLDGLQSSSERTIVLNCDCPEAYDGRFCADDYDGCSDIICFDGVSCVDQPAPGVGAICDPCPGGYFGDGEKCIDLDECGDGTHNCSDLCLNTPGGFECDCSPGYALVTSTACADIDECVMLNGGCHQVCNNLEGGVSCSCLEGFELTSDNRTCQVLPESSCGTGTACSQNCVIRFGEEVCSCDPGYLLAGDERTCLDIDECLQTPCDQVCTNFEGGFQCSCDDGFTLGTDAISCQDIDECSLAAQNNTNLCTSPMFCSNTAGGFECLCPGGTVAAGGTCIPTALNVRRVNDSVIGNPLMTVPLYLTNTSAFSKNIELGENEVVNLCFEVHGRAEEYFNLVSDSCVSVNAHYRRAHPLLGYNMINEIAIRAVGIDGTCRNIAVSINNCQAFIDDIALDGTYSSGGVSIRTFRNRVRISLPNCQDLDLVMWVFCERNELRGFPELREPDIIVGVDMLRFVIARGYNIRESAHGLLGQFWNVPINVAKYTGPLSDGTRRDDTYIVTVNYPGSPTRRFLTFLDFPTWDKRGKEYCLYGGNRQGGGIFELKTPNDPIIEGRSREYIVSGPFDVDFEYSHFESSECE